MRGEPDRSRRILVVDDNQDAADMLGAALESGLPVMDGYELAERLRELHLTPEANARLQLIAITGYGQDADRERSARAGFESHLVKPLDLAHLTRAIQAASLRRSAE